MGSRIERRYGGRGLDRGEEDRAQRRESLGRHGAISRFSLAIAGSMIARFEMVADRCRGRGRGRGRGVMALVVVVTH